MLNGGAYWKILRYDAFLHSPLASADLTNEDILHVPQGATIAQGEQSNLVIPKIGIRVPIVLPKDATKQSILAGMEDGVSLYPGSSLPSSASGRTVILGHSSKASWYFGDYATVFALLPKLAIGDVFTVVSDRTTYTYQVVGSKVLTPSDTNTLLATTPSEPEVDLVTCFPIGSASKRIIIQAQLVSGE